MKLLRDVAMVACVILTPLMVTAASPPEAQVDYSADSIMESEGGMTMKSRVYHTMNKDRMDMGGSDGMTMIIRKDKNIMWQLMGDMYMEMPIDVSTASGMDAFNIVEQTDVGQETVNGVKTTKSKVVAVKKDGSGKFGGFFWTTKEGITVKMDLLSKEGDKKVRVTNELTNLKIEKQNPALFEIPAGYTKNDMGAMMGGIPNLEEMKSHSQSRKRPSQESQADDSSAGQMPDMNKMMKGLFGK